MMHKEVVGKKKAPVIAISLVIITCMLYIHEGLKFIKFKNGLTLEICNVVIIIITIMILIREIVLCNTSYKYSIIADKLIINRICRCSEKNLTSIKIPDIEYIGAKSGIPKNLKYKSVGSFRCSLISNHTCVCIYKKEGKLYKFSFEPSEDFIYRINKRII